MAGASPGRRRRRARGARRAAPGKSARSRAHSKGARLDRSQWRGLLRAFGVLGWIAAALATVALVAVWGTWMAPRSRRRLPLPARLVLGCGLVVLAALLAHASGLHGWAWWFGGLGIPLMAAGQSLQGH